MIEFLEVILKTLRVIGAIGIITFLPGFVLSLALFQAKPRQTDRENALSALERIFISIISSLSISAISTYALYRTGSRLTTGNILTILSVVTLLSLAAALLRSGKLPVRSTSREESIAFLRTSLVPRARAAIPFFGYSLLFILGLSLVIYRYSSKDLVPLTEFYIQPDRLNGQGVAYSVDGNTLNVPIAITNHESIDREYRIEGVIPSRKVSLEQGLVPGAQDPLGVQRQVLKRVMVESEDTQASEVSIAILEKDGTPYVDLLLFEVSKSEPIARLRVWLAAEREYANP